MGCDRISELPEYLLTQILSYLPTKESVKTSVLSKRWEFLWLMVPVLDLEVHVWSRNGEDLESFIDKYLEFNHRSRMQKFKIEYEPWDYERLVAWIGTAVDRGIQHLDVQTEEAPYMPQNIYKSKTLVSLTLVSVTIAKPEFVVSLPCLKIMHLEDVRYDNDPLIMEKVISGCPALENLTLIRPMDFRNQNNPKFLRVRSQTLKSFFLTFEHCMGGTNFSVEIDAPRLEIMSFRDKQSDRIVVKNLRSLVKIDIDSEFNVKFGGSPLEPENLSKRDTICDFLKGISSVIHMIITQRTLEVLYQYSKLGPIPKFVNLCRLDASYSKSTLQLLPVLLESCPNLEKLIMVGIEFAVSVQPEQIDLTYVPRCLKSTLEYVEIKNLIMKEETGIKLVNYFLENSAVLKKLTVRFRNSYLIMKQELDIYMNLLTSTKCSRKCQVCLY